MIQRLLFAAFAVCAVFFAGRWLVHALAPETTRIRWALVGMADGFNATHTNAVLEGLASDFVDGTYGADRQDVRAGLARLFFERKEPETRKFLYRVELPREEMQIELDRDDEARAHAVVVARFFERKGASEALAWETRIDARLAERDGDWVVLASEHTTLNGKLLR